MIEYQVTIDRENKNFAVYGPFDPNSHPINIPEDYPLRKSFIDFFLHKADLERGIDFLRCISIDKDLTVNEGLFIAGLNNCMKCFKYSKSRNKLEKEKVFKTNDEMLLQFSEFETMRDKHFDHDENGMLQATAFLLITDNQDDIFGGPPSVVWNKVVLDYYLAGLHLQEIMQYVRAYLMQEIDAMGNEIEKYYSQYPYEELMKYETSTIELASTASKRK